MIAADKRSNVIRKLNEIVINRIAAGEGNHASFERHSLSYSIPVCFGWMIVTLLSEGLF